MLVPYAINKMNFSILRRAKNKTNNSSFKVKSGVKNGNLIIRKSNFRLATAANNQTWTTTINGPDNYKLNRTDYMKHYANIQPHSLSIKDMERFRADCETILENECEVESRIQVENISSFLVNELLIRCANVIVENKELPRALRQNDHFQRLEANYGQTFDELFHLKNTNNQSLTNFNDILRKIKNRHGSVIEDMAYAVQEYKHHCENNKENYLEKPMTKYLDRFYMSRIGIRFLIEHHLDASTEIYEKFPLEDGCDGSEQKNGFSDSTKKNQDNIRVDRFGRLEKQSVSEIMEICYENARSICDNLYMDSPELELDITENVESTYPCAHLEYIFFEILKNAMKATMERCENERLIDTPPIKVLIRQGKSDVTIKISDQAGGAPSREIEKWFDYMYSTSPAPVLGCNTGNVMAGFGVGLPLSKLYARFLSGDLDVQTVNGYGTDVYIYLKNKNLDKREVLPNYCKDIQKKSFKKYGQTRKDWIGGEFKM